MMRKSSYDNHFRNTKNNSNNNVLSNTQNQNVESARLSSNDKNRIQERYSSDNVVVRTRGFKPSDRHDPIKKAFLEKLTSKILHFDMTEYEKASPVRLDKLLAPSSDLNEEIHMKNKKVYASSYFYAPNHPTVEEQVELARKISHSLSDVKNMKSKGQSMYVNRKKRSVKWIHDGSETNEEEESMSSMTKVKYRKYLRDKVPLKCMMNPNGKVMDIYDIQAMGEEVNIEPRPSPPEKLFDIVRDLKNQKGRGAEIFAKRRKRSEKWVVEQEQFNNQNNYPCYSMCPETKETDSMNSDYSYYNKFTPPQMSNKHYYNIPNAIDSLEEKNIPYTGYPMSYYPGHHYYPHNENCLHPHGVQKVYLREVAVGTEPEVQEYIPYKNDVQKKKSEMHEYMAYGKNGLHKKKAHNYSNKDGHCHNSNPNCKEGMRRYKTNSNNRMSTQFMANNAELNFTNGNAGRNINENGASRQYSPLCNEDTDYTPVPVKQLIQEFEKTCRPIMQYDKMKSKNMSGNNCNDIYRFFQSYSVDKYDNKNDRSHNYDEQVCKLCKNNGFSSSEEQEELNDDEDDESLDNSMTHIDLCRINDYKTPPQDDVLDNCSTNYYNDIQNGHGIDSKANNSPYSYSNASVELDTKTSFANPDVDTVDNWQRVTKEYSSVREQIMNNQNNIGPQPTIVPVTYNGPRLSSYQNLTNYNTAPRGWDQSQSVYKPVKFEKPQESLVYSDF